ncbi:hypothetical protein ACVOMS_25320 [Bradyrhizobium guangxiense]
MTSAPSQSTRDWLGSVRTGLLAWWMPKAAILGGLFAPVSARAVIWIIALIWMGTACLLNARRCNRTHCRYTGPYYFAMIVPVFVFDIGVVPRRAAINRRKRCQRTLASSFTTAADVALG